MLVENLCTLTLTCAGLDDLDLTGDNTSPDGVDFTLAALGSEATWGNPVPVDESVAGWMVDGAIAWTRGYENRELSFKVLVSGATSAALAAGEAALVSRMDRRVSLSWVPPEGSEWAAASVFEVETGHMDFEFDDLGESRLERIYTIRLTARPWARSQTLSVASAISTGTTPTVSTVDACTSLTGWMGGPNTPTTSGGAINVTADAAAGTSDGATESYLLFLERTGTVSTTGYAFLRVDHAVSGAGTKGTKPVVTVDSTALERVAAHGSVAYYALPDDVTSFSDLVVSCLATPTRAGTVTLSVADVALTDAVDAVGSGAQTFRTLTVDGSVRTFGSLHVWHPTDALGKVLIHTGPDLGAGYVPAMRTYRTSDPTPVTDTSALSGYHDTVVPAGASSPNWWIPAEVLTPGEYVLVARMKSTTADPYPFAVFATPINADGAEAVSALVTFTAANAWQWCVLGKWTLPPVPIPAESAVGVAVTVGPDPTSPEIPGSSPTIVLDELYCLNITDDRLTGGAVTMVDAGDATHLWIDAPTAEDPLPHVFAGSLDDRSDAVAVSMDKVTSLGAHFFVPPTTTVFAVTEDASNATVDLTHFARWHTHAGS